MKKLKPTALFGKYRLFKVTKASMKVVFTFLFVFTTLNFFGFAKNEMMKEQWVLPLSKEGVAFKLNKNVKVNSQSLDRLNNGFNAINSLFTLKQSTRKFDQIVFSTFGEHSSIPSNLSNEVYVELVESQKILGTYAAFSSSFNNKPTLLINEDILKSLNDDQLVKILLEEIGHYLDFIYNGLTDTNGDEGELFANRMLGNALTSDFLQRVALENDHLNLVIDGQEVAMEMASLLFTATSYFAQEYTGATPNKANLESNTLALLSPLPGTRTLFVSDPPTAATYSGNNVRGNLYAIDGNNNLVGKYYGEVSRLFKVGSAAVAAQFYVYPTSDPAVTNIPSTTIFIDFFAATPNFTSGLIVKTSSDPVATALNALLPSNTPPTSQPVTGNATEAGGLLNAIVGVPATGNVTLGATDSDFTYQLDLVNNKLLTVSDPLSLTTVKSLSTGATGNFTATTTSNTLAGAYGSLQIYSDGTFTYTTNETLVAVEALRTSSNTLSESFTYTMTDSKGGFTSNTLTIVINAKNDTPIAKDDYNFAKESIQTLSSNQYTSTDLIGLKATGNVLPNDTDVDRFSEVLNVTGVVATANVTTISQSTTLNFTSIPSNVSVGRFVWMDGDQIVNNQSNGFILKSSTGVDITVVSVDQNSKTATLSSVPYSNGQILQLPAGTILGFSNNASGASYQESIISGSTFSPSTILKINTQLTGQISAGMTVTGTNVPAGTTVSSITYTSGGQIDQLILNQSIGVIAQDLTFTANPPLTLTGQYGTLNLNADGSYVYTPIANNPILNSGDVVVDKFLYTIKDALNATNTATLYITVYGAGANDPNAVNDVIAATENGGINNGTTYSSPTGNILSNDTKVIGTLSVLAVNVPSVSPSNALSLNQSISYNGTTYAQKITGLYGDLYINSDGTYIYVVNNTLPAIEALKSGETVADIFQYQLTDGTRTDWATITINIAGSYDAPVANPDASSLTIGGTSTGAILSNDTDVDFQDTKTVTKVNSTVIAGTGTTTIQGTYGTLTIKADGTYSYVVDPTNPDVVALTTLDTPLQEVFTYEIKDGNNLTSTSSLTIAVNAANKAPVNTNPVSASLYEGSTLTFAQTNAISIAEPDNNLSGVSFSVTSGTLAFSLAGSTPYVNNGITEGIQLASGAILYYVQDTNTENGSTSVTIYGTKDQVNAAIATLVYSPNSSFVGNDVLTITSTDILGLSNITTTNITVKAVPVAVNDSFSGINGSTGGTTASVFANDTFGGVAITLSNFNLTTTSTPITGVTINVDGTVTVAPNTPAGTYTLTYKICEIANPTNCDEATVTVVVGVAPIDAIRDSFPTINSANGGTTTSVLANDLLNGVAVSLSTVTLSPISVPNGLTLNTDGTITVPPNTPSGTYNITYSICEILNPSNCDQVTVSVVVASAALEANNDSYSNINGKDGNANVGNILSNDTFNFASVSLNDVTLSIVTPATAINNGPVPTIGSTGVVSVPANTPAGTYTITYQLCDKVNTSQCNDAIATIIVAPAPIDAVNDTPTAINGFVGGTTTSVLTNDKLNGVAVVPSEVTLSGVSVPSGLTLNADGTITVAAGTAAGTYSLTYKICEKLNPTNCDNATVSITVNPPVIDAVNDTPGAINGLTGGTTPSVIANDKLNGAAVVANDITLTGINVPNGLTLNSDGTITVAPNTPSGTYTVTYQICEKLNPSNCDQASVTVIVNAANIDAVNDSPTSINGFVGGTTSSIIANDKLNGVAVSIADVYLTGVTVPAGLTLNTNGTVTVAAGTAAGTYTLTYQICEKLNPSNCDQANISVTVDAAPIDAVNDSPNPVNGITGATIPSVLGNDKLNGSTLSISKIDLTGVTVPSGLTLNADGTITVAPGTPAGSYAVTYQICEKLNPTNCDQATVTVQVITPVQVTLIQAVDDVMGSVNGTNGDVTASVLLNDGLGGMAVNIADINLTTVSAPTGITLNANGTISVAAGTAPGSYELVYQICEKTNPTNCDDATVTINVLPCIDFPLNDCDGDGVTNAQELLDGTNPTDPCDYKSSSQVLSNTSTSWRNLDCDGDGTKNGVDPEPLNFCVGGVKGVIPALDSPTYNKYFRNADCDGDGIPNHVETNGSGLPINTDGDGEPNYLDGDSDNDGIPDSIEAGPNPKQPIDTDGDGWADYQDLDSDNDGIADAEEKGANGTNPVDTDKDGTPDYLDLDSDGDTIKDAWEAIGVFEANRDDNYNGMIDKAGVFIDSNNNGWADISEGQKATDTDGDKVPDYLDSDSDNDCIPDAVEMTSDMDKDFRPNYRDTDSDGDGIPDNVEAVNCSNPIDTDKDGMPDYLDLDSDNDGIPDAVEAGPNPATPVDTDGDGMPDYRDLDSDNDGIPDTVEKGPDGNNPVDTDKDGIPDYRDLDSDNDGIPDTIEKGPDGNNPIDTDKDGIPDYRDLDSDNDGIPDTIEKGPDGNNPIDTDKDGIPDYRDLDSDNDGIPDTVEKGPDGNNPIDTDKDGIPDYRDLDSDNDGIPDTIEKGPDGNNPIDTDKDGIPDYRDLDSDNDGIPDAIEKGPNGNNPVDTDKDGIPDYRDLDSDNDGIPDTIEKGPDGNNPIDTDKDGIPDYRDLDSDNDGYPDAVEKGPDGNNPVDTDKDGIPDYRDIDSDNDGILDKLENDIDYGGLPDCDGDGIDNRIDPDPCSFATQGLSPNNDGINDVLIIPGIKATKNHMTIYNRWGNVVYEVNDYQNNWGGECNQSGILLSDDNKLPDGTYYYVIDYYGVKPTVGTYVYINRQAK